MAVQGHSILICDDSLLIRTKLRNLLEGHSHHVLEAKNGLEGIEIYKANRPEVVFMDIVMPEADGLEALRQIRQFDKTAKVVMLSSTGTAIKLMEALKSGATDFIQKPYEKDQILSAIAKAVQGKV